MEAYLARPFETRATQQMDLDELGGFWLMPVQMMNDILKIADNMVYVRQLARVTPRVDATSLAGRFLEEDVEDADWSGEITPIELTQIKMGLRRLRPKNLNKGVAFSFDIIMQEPSISAFVVERLGYKRGITEERGYLLGNGVNEALGVMTPSDQGIPTRSRRGYRQQRNRGVAERRTEREVVDPHGLLGRPDLVRRAQFLAAGVDAAPHRRTAHLAHVHRHAPSGHAAGRPGLHFGSTCRTC